MAEQALKAEAGRATGSRASRRLRAQGKVPAVVYGHGIDPVSVAVVRRELRAALTTEAGMNALIDLGVDGQQHLTIVRDVQRDPVRNEVTHVDFVVVRRDEIISVEVPIVLTGVAEEVKREAGTVDQVLFELTVHATPGTIPNEFVVDISELTIGDTVRVGDLSLPSGVTTDVDPEEPVAVAQVSRATIEAEQLEAEAAEEAAGPEGAEGEEGGAAGEEAAGEAQA
ncbi:MAG: 50S ribosomal protein L25 [Actinomycetota bacterium]|nr:50S ribosomal protein L25 [Actinomycetota bacterium]MDP9019803.1 50S ribosomal protein L25 [Actinomycetota bacterium]